MTIGAAPWLVAALVTGARAHAIVTSSGSLPGQTEGHVRRRSSHRGRDQFFREGPVSRWGRLAVLALVGALGAFAFADGLHSVHHLPDHRAASRCAIAAASASVVGDIVDLVPVALPPSPRLVALEEVATVAPGLRPVWAEHGRAPPVSPS